MPRIALYQSHKDNHPIASDLAWSELCELLSEFTVTDCQPCAGKDCPHKRGAAWSPVEIEGTRANDHVQAITVAVFDLDHVTADQLFAVAERIEGYSYLVHSTHSHRPPDDQCLRLVMELSEPVPAKQWREFLKRAIAFLQVPADPACKDLSRLYFLPTSPNGCEHMAIRGEGKALNVAAVLAWKASPSTPAPALEALPPAPADEAEPEASAAPVDLVELIGRLREVRRNYAAKGDAEHTALVDRILKGEALAQPGARDNTVNQAASILGAALPAGTPEDAAIELLRRSIGAMDTEPEGLAAWLDKAAFSYRRAMARRVEHDRVRDEINERLRVSLKGRIGARQLRKASDRVAGGGADPVPPVDGSGDQGSGEAGADVEDEGSEPDAASDVTEEELAADPQAWARLLLWVPVKKADEEPKLKQCSHNAEVLLTYHESWKGALRFNEVTKTIEVNGSPIPLNKQHVSVLATAVTNWLQAACDLNLPEHVIGSVILLVARRFAFDPVRDYLLGLQWDGVERADSFLSKYCGARLADSLGTDISEHVRRISRRWLISAVARGLAPGCKVDTVLVLEGKQGIYKTGVFEALGGAFFADSPINVADKDSRMLAACNWIIELAELAAFKRSETETLKAFFTTRTDKFRPPYGKAIEAFLRRCVFVGTTNRDDYLTDSTGNRRYWPVYCDAIDIAAIIRDRDQLWAEAVALYLAGESCPECPNHVGRRCALHRWWLDRAEAEVAEAQAEDRVDTSSSLLNAIAAWWYSKEPKNRPMFVKTGDAAKEALLLPSEKITRALEMDVGNALRHLGFTRERKRVYGAKAWVYTPSERLKQHPKVNKGAEHLTVADTDKVA